MDMAFAAWVRLALFLAGLVFFGVLELLAPYRRPTLPRPRRWLDNLALTVINGVAVRLIFSGSVLAAAAYVDARHLGLLNLAEIPSWARIAATVVFLDFMLYAWHLANHEMPLLWRFHRVHHCDGNMDVSTATRFHAGEILISTAIKMGLVFFLGASPAGVVLFESVLLACAQFEHSSVRVPAWLERAYWILFVPPSMHRIHHSVVIRERDTNYGTIFSLWDRALGTLLTKTPQDTIKIGLGAYPRPEKLPLFRLLAMPFTRPVR